MHVLIRGHGRCPDGECPYDGQCHLAAMDLKGLMHINEWSHVALRHPPLSIQRWLPLRGQLTLAYLYWYPVCPYGTEFNFTLASFLTMSLWDCLMALKLSVNVLSYRSPLPSPSERIVYRVLFLLLCGVSSLLSTLSLLFESLEVPGWGSPCSCFGNWFSGLSETCARMASCLFKAFFCFLNSVRVNGLPSSSLKNCLACIEVSAFFGVISW